MKKCPRCHQKTLKEEEIMNPLSRRDGKTYICDPCSAKEACIDEKLHSPDTIERYFVAKLKKKRPKAPKKTGEKNSAKPVTKPVTSGP